MSSQWKDSTLAYLHNGLLEPNGENSRVLAKLADGNLTMDHQASNTFTMSISDYIETSRVIGALETPKPPNESPSYEESMGPSKSGLITVIRGAPKLASLHDLGTRLNLSPNYLLDHLMFPNSFRVRSLPSRMHRIARIRFISLGSFVFHQPPHPTIMAGLSERLAQKLKDYREDSLGDERVGVDIFREINLHDRGFFSVEQQATLLCYLDTGDTRGWSGILLTDSGQTEDRLPPWAVVAPCAHFHPVTDSGHSSMDWQRHLHGGSDARFLRPEPFLGRFMADTDMLPLEKVMCQRSWIGLACDLLDTSALTWAKFLSFVRASHEAISADPEYQVMILHADKKVLDRATQYFDDMMQLICEMRDSRSAENFPPDLDKQILETTTRLLGDFAFLQGESAKLSKQCSDSVGIAMDIIAISESRASISQAQRSQVVIRYLACLFLPLSIISSIFSMNVKELGQNGPRIALYFIIAVPFTLLSLLFPRIMSVGWQYIQSLRSRL